MKVTDSTCLLAMAKIWQKQRSLDFGMFRIEVFRKLLRMVSENGNKEVAGLIKVMLADSKSLELMDETLVVKVIKKFLLHEDRWPIGIGWVECLGEE